MNPELEELVRLYEAMHTCIGNEQARTNATAAYEAAIQRTAARNKLSFGLLLSSGRTTEKASATSFCIITSNTGAVGTNSPPALANHTPV